MLSRAEGILAIKHWRHQCKAYYCRSWCRQLEIDVDRSNRFSWWLQHMPLVTILGTGIALESAALIHYSCRYSYWCWPWYNLWAFLGTENPLEDEEETTLLKINTGYSYTFTGLVPETEYFFKVRTVNVVGVRRAVFSASTTTADITQFISNLELTQLSLYYYDQRH